MIGVPIVVSIHFERDPEVVLKSWYEITATHCVITQKSAVLLYLNLEHITILPKNGPFLQLKLNCKWH
jgi:hypothetical protein